MFFTWFTVFPIIGLLVGVADRRVLNPAGDKGCFPSTPLNLMEPSSPTSADSALDLGRLLGNNLAFRSRKCADRLRLGGLGGIEANGFVGYYSALFTGIVAIIVSGMVAERWFTRAMTLTSLWSCTSLVRGMKKDSDERDI